MGQGIDTYDAVYVANELDYDKCNNRQRLEDTSPVFTVMGQFFGLSKIFSYTHRLFLTSWIYYNDRADLFKIVDDQLINKTDRQVCWNGQKGGLEGLRQKGWTVLGYLILRREALTRKIGKVNFETFPKLLERPTSLNIPGQGRD